MKGNKSEAGPTQWVISSSSKLSMKIEVSARASAKLARQHTKRGRSLGAYIRVDASIVYLLITPHKQLLGECVVHVTR